MTKPSSNTLNPAVAGLSRSENEAYAIIAARQKKKFVTSTSDVAREWGKDHSHAFRVLKSLMTKGIIERYDDRYYRIP
jgi:predicted transcriptional regulator